MGELLAVAMSRGSVSSGLSVCARGCSERGGGLCRSCPHGPAAAGHTGLCGQPGSGQYLWTVLPGCSVDCLKQEITRQWMENKWDNNNKFILFRLYFSVLSFISMFQMEKKDKPSQFLVQ